MQTFPDSLPATLLVRNITVNSGICETGENVLPPHLRELYLYDCEGLERLPSQLPIDLVNFSLVNC